MKQPWSSLLQMSDEMPRSFVARTCSWPSVTTPTRRLPERARASLFVRRRWLINCKRETGDNFFFRRIRGTLPPALAAARSMRAARHKQQIVKAPDNKEFHA